jgi:hypothetical protein
MHCTTHSNYNYNEKCDSGTSYTKNRKSLESDRDATQAAVEKAVLAASLIDYWNYQRNLTTTSSNSSATAAAAASSSSSSSAGTSERVSRRAMTGQREGSRKRARPVGSSSDANEGSSSSSGRSTSHNVLSTSSSSSSMSSGQGHSKRSVDQTTPSACVHENKRQRESPGALSNSTGSSSIGSATATLGASHAVASSSASASSASSSGVGGGVSSRNVGMSGGVSSRNVGMSDGQASNGDSGGLGLGSLNDHQQLVDAGEFPPCVEELVFNGFEVPKVLDAYSIFGDRFDDMLAYLMQQQRQTRE